MNLMTWQNQTTPRFSLLISFLGPAPALRRSHPPAWKKTNLLETAPRTTNSRTIANLITVAGRKCLSRCLESPITPRLNPFYLPLGAGIHHTAKWLGCLIQQQTFNQAHLPPDPIGG